MVWQHFRCIEKLVQRAVACEKDWREMRRIQEVCDEEITGVAAGGCSCYIVSPFGSDSSVRPCLPLFRLSVIPLVPGIFLLVKLAWLRDDLQLNAAAIQLLGIGNSSGLFLFGGLDPTSATSNNYQPTDNDILRDVALANTPHLVLTMAYYIWNSHLTVMLAANEYDRYAAPPEGEVPPNKPCKKRGLRVSNPIKGTKQRATHFLTVPLRHWVWNTILQATLHWLALQAIFFARVDVLDHWPGSDEEILYKPS